MKIITCHNYYQQPGGEDSVFLNEATLLRTNGCEVFEYTRSNDELRRMPLASITRLLYWNKEVYSQIRELIGRVKPDIVHVHNFFPVLSPAVFYAARDSAVPAIAGLNNQRFMCPGSSFTRNERACLDCVGKAFAYPGALRRCYRNSFAYSFAVASMFSYHRMRGTWHKVVSGYIASTDFYKELFVRHGLPEEKIFVKPHLIEDPGYAPHEGRYALFVGRLDPEKGVFFLLRSWKAARKLNGECRLLIRGSGKCETQMQRTIEEDRIEGVAFVGPQKREALTQLIRQARFIIAPSRGFYETFCLVVAEAFACGIPVIAPRRGVFEEIVDNGKTGILFSPDSEESLAESVQWAWEHQEEMQEMGRNARQVYIEKYLPKKNFYLLQEIYKSVIGNFKRSRGLT